MGLLVLNYTTSQGFVVPQLYLQVSAIRMLKTLQGPNYGMAYTVQAYKSSEDKAAGVSPIPLPNYLGFAEDVLSANDFYDQTIFGFAYDCVKKVWQTNGFVVEDYYPHPPTPTTYIYDCSGYSFRGFNCAGVDIDGYNKYGYNAQGYNRDGYDRGGYNAEGYDRDGYNRSGYNAAGFNRAGYDKDGYDIDGYDKNGINRDGQYKPVPPMTEV